MTTVLSLLLAAIMPLERKIDACVARLTFRKIARTAHERITFKFENVRVVVRDFTELEAMPDREDLETMSRAAYLAWRSLTPESATLDISMKDYLKGVRGERRDISAAYFPATRDMRVALSRMMAFHETLPLDAKLVLIAAHETTHRFQHHVAGRAFLADEDLDPADYDHRPRELEAWNVALNVFKFIYPNGTGSLILGDQHLPVPEVSTIVDTPTPRR